jgi:hypothetical protein
MWKGLVRNMGERREGDKGTKRIKERKKESEGLRYKAIIPC